MHVKYKAIMGKKIKTSAEFEPAIYGAAVECVNLLSYMYSAMQKLFE
jgi:hypothetical protein